MGKMPTITGSKKIVGRQGMKGFIPATKKPKGLHDGRETMDQQKRKTKIPNSRRFIKA